MTERYFKAVKDPIGSWFNGDLEGTSSQDGAISLTIEQEQAVGSYNSDVTTTATLTRQEALRLGNWLIAVAHSHEDEQ